MTGTKEKKVADIKKEADAITCPVKRALFYMEEFLEGPMCGKCFPCEMGCYEARQRLRTIQSGAGDGILYSPITRGACCSCSKQTPLSLR